VRFAVIAWVGRRTRALRPSRLPVDEGEFLAAQGNDRSINANRQSKASLNSGDKGPHNRGFAESLSFYLFFPLFLPVYISQMQFQQLEHQLFAVEDNLAGAASKIT